MIIFKTKTAIVIQKGFLYAVLPWSSSWQIFFVCWLAIVKNLPIFFARFVRFSFLYLDVGCREVGGFLTLTFSPPYFHFFINLASLSHFPNSSLKHFFFFFELNSVNLFSPCFLRLNLKKKIYRFFVSFNWKVWYWYSSLIAFIKVLLVSLSHTSY